MEIKLFSELFIYLLWIVVESHRKCQQTGIHNVFIILFYFILFSEIYLHFFQTLQNHVLVVAYRQCFFFGRNLARFRPDKYDFNLYKGFSMEKMAQIRQILQKVSKSLDFYSKFRQVAEDIKMIVIFKNSYLVCSQIWLKRTIRRTTTQAHNSICLADAMPWHP